MNEREKKLLILVLVVAIGAGAFMFMDSDSSSEPSSTVELEEGMENLPKFDPQKYPELTEKIVAIELTPNQKKILAQSAIPWQKDIFYQQPQALQNQTKLKKVEKKLFTYTGFMELGNEIYAIINNHNYKQGDHLDDWPSYSVGKITKKDVTIYTPKKNKLVVPYTEKQVFVWEQPQKDDTKKVGTKKASKK